MYTYDDIIKNIKELENTLNNESAVIFERTSIAGKLKYLLRCSLELVYAKFGKKYPTDKCLRQAIVGLKSVGIKNIVTDTLNNIIDLIYKHDIKKAYYMLKVFVFDLTEIVY